jgi:hypothetical protein
VRSKVLTGLCIGFSALLSLPLMANADTYTVFSISGTDSQRQLNVGLGESGCNQIECLVYEPGTFSGTALVDISTDTIPGATISTCCGAFTESYTTSALTPDLGSGLNLILPVISYANLGEQPLLSLVFDLSSDSVSGTVAGPQAVSAPGIDQVGATYTLDMVGTLTPELTTTIPPMAAPEIDPASAASGLTLLLGGLLVLRGRKRT